MNLYLLMQNDETGYDTYDSCVVVAKTEEAARMIYPNGNIYGDRSYDHNKWHNRYPSGDWTTDPEKVSVTLIGKAAKDLKENSVVIASFNAG